MSSKRVSKEQQVGDLIVSIQSEPVSVGPLQPYRSSKIFHLLKRYLRYSDKKNKKYISHRNKKYRDDPKTYSEAMLDINSEKWMEAIKSKVDLMHSS